MTTVDSRIVTMKFENSQFQKGVSSTLNALSSLKDGLAKLGASKGLSDLNAQASKVNLTPIADQTHGISKAFIAMTTVAVTALANITTAVQAQATEMVKNLSGVRAMADGWSDYELKIGATQTIMAGTGLGIGKVSKYLKELDIYADQTIYSLADMTSNIGKFTNAGVKLPVAVNALKGVAQVAALSGANSGEAARAMYNLGQAIGAGHVKLMDWRSVELANMGTKEFKEQLIQTALEMGSLRKASDGTIVSLKGNEVNYKTFSQTLQDQWLTSKALTSTLEKYSDNTTAIGKKATKAATEVKTFSMMLETLAAAAGTGWTDTFEILFGNLPQATKLWTGITDSVGSFIGAQADARNEMLQGWKDMGGRKALIEGFANIFKAFGAILKPIGKAFREVFPPSTGEGLYKLTEAFRNFTENLIVSEKTSKAIGSVFKALFTVLSVGIAVVKGVFMYFWELGALLSGLAGPVMGLLGAIGNLIAKFLEWANLGVNISGAFDGLIDARAKIFEPIIAGMGATIDVVSEFINGIANGTSKISPIFSAIGSKITSFVSTVKQALSSLDLSSIFSFGGGGDGGPSVVEKGLTAVTTAMDEAGQGAGRLKAAFMAVMDFFGDIGSAFAGLGQKIWEGLGGAIEWVKGKLSGVSAGDALLGGLLALDLAVLAGWYLTIKRFFKGLEQIVTNTGNTIAELGDVFGATTKHLNALTMEVRADALLKIAGALAILAVSLLVLSTIDGKKLATSLGAVAGLITMLVVALKVLDDSEASLKSSARIMILSTSMVALGLAVLALSAAVAILGNMDTATLVKGIASIGAIIGIIVGASALLEKGGGAGKMLAASAAIGILALSLTVFAGAIKLFSAIDVATLADGGLKIVAVLVALGLAMQLMPKNMLATATGLLILSAALVVMSGAMAIFGNFDGETMAKSLIMLAGSLLIIAVALKAMNNSIAGAATILVFAAALAVLVPSLQALGNMSLEQIVKSLLMLVGVFTVLGVAAAVLAPVIPLIVLLAGGIALLGVAAIAVGAGLMMFSIGLATLAASGAAGAAVLTAAIISIAATIPLIMAQFAIGLIAFAKVIATAGPALVKAFTAVLNSLLQAVINVTPKIGKVISTMLETGLRVITNFIPKMIAAGIKILMAFLTGVEKNIGQIVTKATNIVTKFFNALQTGVPKMTKAAVDFMIAFMDSISKQIPRLVDRGMQAVIKLVNGVANAIDNNSAALGAAGGNLARAIIQGMVKGIGGGIGAVKDAAMNLAKSALDSAKNFLGIHSPSKEFEKIGIWSAKGFKKGLVGGVDEVKDAMKTMTGVLRDEMQKQKDAIKDEQAELDELLDSKDRDEKAIAKARERLAAAEEMYAAAKAAREAFANDVKKEREELLGLAKDYDEVTAKINEAKSALDNAIKTRNDAERSIADQYNKLPDITDKTTVDEYTSAIQSEAEKTATFLASLNKLVKMGLDDATYEKLLSEGVGIQPFLDELAAAGPDAVKEVNKATADLEKEAKALGKKASRELHQAGVDSARGLLQGLRSQKEEIRKEMAEIARLISRTVRKELKIKSPSREMMAIGRYTNEGLAQGLSTYSKVVEKSAAGVATTAVDAMKSTMAKVSDAVSGELDSNPVIAPVLDLSQLKKDASGIGSALNAKSLAASVSYGQAASVSTAKEAERAESASVSTEPAAPIVFKQYNNSPKALSHVEIYRQTKNQLSLAKEALTKS